MTNDVVMSVFSDTESSTGSNGDSNAVTAPSVGTQDSAECSSSSPPSPTPNNPPTHTPQILKPKPVWTPLSRLPLRSPPPLKPSKTATVVFQPQPVLIPQSPLLLPPSLKPSEIAIAGFPPQPVWTPHSLLLSSSTLKPNETATAVFPPQPSWTPYSSLLSLPSQRFNYEKETGVVPLLPSSLKPNKIATAVTIPQRYNPVGVTFSRSYGGGSRPRDPVGLTFSSRYGDGNNRRYHPYLSQMDHRVALENHSDSSQRTVNFLSQMEARSSAPRQVRREHKNHRNERLAEWGATLTLGNGRSRPRGFEFEA